MKIGILTLPLHTNYGGILQAYALQTILEKMGHDVTVINQDQNLRRGLLRQSLSLVKYLLMKYIKGENISYKSDKRINRERQEREQHTQEFIRKNIHTYSVRNLTKDVPDIFDAIIVGSDQVWRSKYFVSGFHCSIENAFLEFAKVNNVKRIAYAASFGIDYLEYTEEEKKKCANLLNSFTKVSVRELSGIKICKNFFNVDNVQWVLDPTMLLNKEDYIELVIKTATPKSPGNLLCYFLDDTEEKQQLTKQISEDRFLQPFIVNSKIDDKNVPQSERIQPPLEQWLRGFMDADFVVTDSFHACVFSIIFNKPFVVIGNKGRGMTRFDSLLSQFSLGKNLISKKDEYKPEYTYGINEETRRRFEDYRHASLSFLKSALQ